MFQLSIPGGTYSGVRWAVDTLRALICPSVPLGTRWISTTWVMGMTSRCDVKRECLWYLPDVPPMVSLLLPLICLLLPTIFLLLPICGVFAAACVLPMLYSGSSEKRGRRKGGHKYVLWTIGTLHRLLSGLYPGQDKQICLSRADPVILGSARVRRSPPLAVTPPPPPSCQYSAPSDGSPDATAALAVLDTLWHYYPGYMSVVALWAYRHLELS